jgi:hypothetical protein
MGDIDLLVEREGQRVQWDELVARAQESAGRRPSTLRCQGAGTALGPGCRPGCWKPWRRRRTARPAGSWPAAQTGFRPGPRAF